MMLFFRFLLFSFCLFFAAALTAQSPNRVTIKGIAVDTMGEKLEFATVMLLSPKDTTLVNFTRTDAQGAFSFKNVKNAPYLLKITYIGYLPYQQHLNESATETKDLGNVRVKPISTELMEVVIRTAKAPLRIKGDTIEYDATTFKVPPGSTVEDLLRRLPGIEVDADGNIKAQGRDVERVYVDGKTFFGDDPKSATKNLGAETISKVQVYDDKSEQAKLTGVDDGKKEKAMNLELKEEYKKGAFGKITGAYGTEDRWAARGNYNRFNPKQQLSFIGYGNNINQTGVNWEDYGEFKGQNFFNDRDNGDFGFSSGRQYFYLSDDEPVNNFDGRGFTDNFGAGSNYNYDHKKTKFNGSYFYNQTKLNLDQFAFQENFLPEQRFSNTDTLDNQDFRGAHNLVTRLAHDLDSSNTLIVSAKLRFSHSTQDHRQNQFFDLNENLTDNSLNINNNTNLDAWRLNSNAIFRHRFKKQSRSFAASAGYNNTQSDGTENLFSLNRFFGAGTFTEQVRQLNTNNNATQQYKSSLLFTEPVAKGFYWESFLNYSRTDNEVNRQVNDLQNNSERIDNLSVFFDNQILYSRLGSSLRYSNKGLNASVGLAAQELRLKSRYAIDKGMPPAVTPLDRKFRNLTPNVDINYEFPNNYWFSAGYGYSINEPQISDLQPVANVNNPAFRVEGNPALSPERNHSISLNLNHWNPANFSNIGINLDANLYDDKIVYNKIVEIIDSVGVRTTTRPDNVGGASSIGGWMWTGFPIIKTKLTMNINGNLNFGQSPSFVNGVENETTNNRYGINAGLNATPTQKLIIGLNSGINFTNISYSIQSEQNQKIRNYTIDGSLKWQFASKFFIESNLDYSVFRNDQFDFNQSVAIWNASLRHIFGKSNRFEARLAGFDLLNQRVNIQQYGSANYISRSIAPTLARYVMLSMSYNLRGYEAKLSKNNWW